MGKILINSLSNFYKMLGDPTRLRILEALIDSEISVNNIADKLDMSQSAISHQLQLLRAHNIVIARRLGQIVKYRIASDYITNFVKQGLNCELGVIGNGEFL
ncbi:MAG TPA: metalloregulator ArsR/SmtB family transcription factor [Bacilli bacterium]|nr:metalloregulator ArsR/SmtB family transcription factor [Bacilli bacterium]